MDYFNYGNLKQVCTNDETKDDYVIFHWDLARKGSVLQNVEVGKVNDWLMIWGYKSGHFCFLLIEQIKSITI